MATITEVRRNAMRADIGDLIFIGGQVSRVTDIVFYRSTGVPAHAPIPSGYAAKRLKTVNGSRWFVMEDSALPCDIDTCLCGSLGAPVVG